jgi:hypothetical protein
LKSRDKKDFATLFVELAEPREEILVFPVRLWRFPVVVVKRRGRESEWERRRENTWRRREEVVWI